MNDNTNMDNTVAGSTNATGKQSDRPLNFQAGGIYSPSKEIIVKLISFDTKNLLFFTFNQKFSLKTAGLEDLFLHLSGILFGDGI